MGKGLLNGSIIFESRYFNKYLLMFFFQSENLATSYMGGFLGTKPIWPRLEFEGPSPLSSSLSCERIGDAKAHINKLAGTNSHGTQPMTKRNNKFGHSRLA